MLSPIRIAGSLVDPFGLGGAPTVGVGGLVSLPRYKAKGSELRPGQYLDRGEALVTKNGGVVIMQSAGNLVLYGPNGKGQHTALWWTHDHNTPATRATMTRDGSLVLTDPKGGVVMDIRPRSKAARILFQEDGNLVWYDARGTAVLDAQTDGWQMGSHRASSKNLFDKITSIPAQVAAAVEKIPVVGDVVHVAGEIYAAPFNLAANIASGERLDHAFIDAGKAQLKIIKDVAPYAATVVSFVPGVGTGVAAALAAGIAIAEGQSLTEAAKAAIRNAIPGGALATTGFDMAVKVASGENVGKAALDAARSQLPPAAQKAFDIGLAVATGQKLQTALVSALASFAPGQLQTILDAGQKALNQVPGLAEAIKHVPIGEATDGFKLAAGLIGHAGINEKALIAARDQLPPEVRQGFDAALKVQEQHVPWLKNVVSAPAPTAAGAGVFSRAMAQAKTMPTKPSALREPPTRQPTVAPKPVASAVPAKPPALREPPTRRPAAAPKPVVAAAPTRPRAAPPAKPAAAPSRVAEYAPYPNMGALGVGSLWGSSAWRWFTVYANGAPIVQRGPVWLSERDATVEEMRFLESTQGRNYIGTVARWNWNADTHQWRRESGALGALGACFDVDSKTWGPPITDMSREMDRAGRSAVHGSGGRPRAVRGPDGVDYLFAIENDVLIARPSVAAGGALSGPPFTYAPYLA